MRFPCSHIRAHQRLRRLSKLTPGYSGTVCALMTHPLVERCLLLEEHVPRRLRTHGEELHGEQCVSAVSASSSRTSA
jgi:hypothetical protein